MMRRMMLGMALAVMLSIFNLAGNATATVWYVDNNAPSGGDGLSWRTALSSVQAGITAAAAGDEVWVKYGVYYETLVLKNGVALYGHFAGYETSVSERSFPSDNLATILDGQQVGTVVTIANCSSQATRIDGFNIRNGNGPEGGGILCSLSSPTIVNNTISGNSAPNRSGGGILVTGTGAAPLIENNTISGNTAGGPTNGLGGGICCADRSSPTIRGNRIVGNVCYTFGVGGGVLSYGYASPRIIGNDISSNSADWGGGIYEEMYVNSLPGETSLISGNTITGNSAVYGGGIHGWAAAFEISNNIIAGNTASTWGAGISCRSDGLPCTPAIINNTIVGNHSNNGSGIMFENITHVAEARLINNIIAFNDYCAIEAFGITRPLLSRNDVYGNLFGYCSIDTTGSTDISVDPLLSSWTSGNYHLRGDSPVINGGDNTVVGADWTDIDGEPRVNLSDGVGIVDIGADEYSDTTPPAVTNTVPTDGAIEVSLNQVITVTFSENIQVVPPGSGILLLDEKRLVPVDRTLSVSGNVLTITPVGSLIKNTAYSVTIPNFALKDMAGNELADDKIFYFTTVKH